MREAMMVDRAAAFFAMSVLQKSLTNAVKNTSSKNTPSSGYGSQHDSLVIKYN